MHRMHHSNIHSPTLEIAVRGVGGAAHIRHHQHEAELRDDTGEQGDCEHKQVGERLHPLLGRVETLVLGK